MKLLITVQKSWLLEVTFLKSSYSAWWAVNSNEFSKPFVKPASAIKDRKGFFPGLLSFVYTVDIFANLFAFWCDNKFLVYLYTQKTCASLSTNLPQPWNLNFSKQPLAPSSGKWYLETMVWALGVLIAVGLAIVSQFFHWIKLEYIVYSKQTLSLYGYFQSKSNSGQ